MTMPSSGPLSLGGTSSPVSVAQELGLSLTATISMNDTAVRLLAGEVFGGTTWSMNLLYGKSNRVSLSYTFSSNTANASLDITSIFGYRAGKSDITVTIDTGVYLYSTSTGTPGLSLTGGTAGDTITLVNNGFIMGQGGVGGNSNFVAAGAGGTALSLGYPTTVNNTNGAAYIGGGGGGGGGGNSNGGGGGAGGGVGGSGTYVAGGGGAGLLGGVGSPGGAGVSPGVSAGGGGGGRLFPGTGGVAVASANNASTAGNGGTAGGGGSAQSVVKGSATSGAGGSGSAVGGAGGATVRTGSCSAGGGGGWGAAGGASTCVNSTPASVAGGAGGKAVALNGFSITWTSGDTTRVYGSVA